MANAYGCRTKTLGTGKGYEKHVKAPNKLISVQDGKDQKMISYEVDPRRVEIIAKGVGMDISNEA